MSEKKEDGIAFDEFKEFNSEVNSSILSEKQL